MQRRHQRTLEELFRRPPPLSMEWRRIEALFTALGCEAIEGNGSRVRFVLNGVIVNFHRPHPEKEAKPYQIRDARKFLREAGVTS